MRKNLESKIREYAGPQTVNHEWVRVSYICSFTLCFHLSNGFLHLSGVLVCSHMHFLCWLFIILVRIHHLIIFLIFFLPIPLYSIRGEPSNFVLFGFAAQYLQLAALANGCHVCFQEVEDLVHLNKGDVRKSMLDMQLLSQSGSSHDICDCALFKVRLTGK